MDEKNRSTMIKLLNKIIKRLKSAEKISDGYHTFEELYEFRLLYNSNLFNEWALTSKYEVHKSKKHNDGEYPFGKDSWFIVMAETPFGQISNHYTMDNWDLFQIPERERANKWDGHTSTDVMGILHKLTIKTQ